MEKFIIKKYNKQKKINDLNSYLHMLKFDKPVSVKVETLHKKTTFKQRGFYFGVWIKILCFELYGLKNIDDVTEYYTLMMHEDLKRAFLKPIGTSRNGHKVYSIKGLNTVRFTEYTDKIKFESANHHGIQLFYPDEQPYFDELLIEYNL